jgi:hypothetical protein
MTDLNSIPSAPIELILPTLLYDDWIKDQLPLFQRDNRSNMGGVLRISFASCEWASPFPLLAIATEVMSFSERGRILEIDLGVGSGSDKGAQFRWRTLKYLSLHGFLNTFISRKDLDLKFQFDKTGERGDAGEWYSGEAGLRNLRTVLERSHLDLIYGDSIVLPATTWELPPSTNLNLTEIVRAKVSDLLMHADKVLFKFKTESRKYRDVTLQRLNQVLLELVENSAEHAYPEGITGFVGLYARVRNTNSDAAIEARGREFSRSPLLSKILLSEKQQQIELFVLDVGRGLFSDIGIWRNGEIGVAIKDHPLRKTASVLFIKALSRHNRLLESVSQLRGGSTGLVHLDSILRHQNDSTRIITGNEWIAGSHPRPPGFQDNAVTSGGYLIQPSPINGTFFHLGISPSVIPELNVQWFSSDKSSSEDVRLSVIKKFSNTKSPSRLESRVIDIRNGEGLSSVQNRVRQTSESLGGTIVRVNRIAEKNLINQIVVAWIRGSAKSNRPVSNLFLCDLGRYQAIDTVWVIEHLFSSGHRLGLEGSPGDMTIFLVTEDLCCTGLPVTFKIRRDGKFQVRVGRSTANIQKLDNRLVYLLEELRVRDSVALWTRAKDLTSSKNPNPVMLQDVLWPTAHASKVLPYYINFAVLIQDEDAARSIRRSLRRLLALFPLAHGIALDMLVGASLHDALKWLILPPKNSLDRVLVGSLSVSGSTLKRFRQPLKTHIVGIVDCIRTPYFDTATNAGSIPHLAALLWDPSLPTRTENKASYQRVGRSAYVEAVRHEPRRIAYDEPLYVELESARLIKVGHWSNGDCHGLLEINTQIAIDQSGASESGAITWLVAELTAICKKNPVVLAFPVDKLAYRLAHHVKSRLKMEDLELGGGLMLLPLSFMPCVAGGLKRFAPLVIDAAQGLANPLIQKRPVAIFLDFGFITNRTVRHSVRQLTDVGFENIQAIGLLNRSSAPELPSENMRRAPGSAAFPKTYWRWNVPVLGIGTHCPLCSAMPALGRLGQLVNKTHIDLVFALKEIGDLWAVRDITDSWEEFGLSPLPLSDSIRNEMAPLLARICVAEVYSSSTLTARVIEYLRSTGDTDTPFQIAKSLMSANEYEHAVELLSVVLLLAGDGFSRADIHDYVTALSNASIQLGSKTQISSSDLTRQTCLLGLVVIVFATQSATCKMAVVRELTRQLSIIDVVNSPTVRLALLALTTDSDVSNDVQGEFEKLCMADRKNTLLLHNYHSLRPFRGNVRDSWDKLTQAFGRSVSHSQQSELGNIKLEFTRSANPANALPRIKRLASLLAQCDQNFVMNTLGLDPHHAIDAIHQLESLIQSKKLSALEFNGAIDRVFSDISNKLHKTLVRYGDRAQSPLIYDVFFEMIESQATINGLALMDDIVPTINARTEYWPAGIGDYFPLGEQVGRLFGEIFSNIRGKSALLMPPESSSEFVGLDKKALGWFWFDFGGEPISKGITIVIVTGLESIKSVSPYNPKVTGLTDFNVKVSSAKIADRYFEIRVRIPSLASILEAS